MARRPDALLSSSLAALGARAAAATRPTTADVGETEGIYVDVDELNYQVQVSRHPQPARTRTRPTCRGCPRTTAEPAADEVWFAVFMRVENETDEPHASRRGVRDRGHAGQRVRADRARHRGQPVRLRARPSSAAERAAADPELARVGQHDPGRAAAVQDAGQLARQPPARVRDRERRAAATTRSSTSTSSQRRLEHRPRHRRGGVAARALADEHHGDRELRPAGGA